MSVSSATPEVASNRCSICGQSVVAEPSEAPPRATCPPCGKLLGWFQERVEEAHITPDTPFLKLARDSIGYVELVMELEEEFDRTMPGEGVVISMTVGDLIRYVRSQPRDPAKRG